jgi:hypothetical protein
MMKVFSVIKYVFTSVGIVLLAGAAYSYEHTRSFLAEAVQTDGTVIALEPVRGNDSTTYRPRVRFEDADGRTVEVSSSASTNPPSYSVGETVRVFYRRGTPDDAKLDGYFSLWGAATILAGLGTVFTLIGAGVFVFVHVSRKREEELRASGMRVTTVFTSVELNKFVRVNGRHPFRVLTQWRNPTTSQVHLFHSQNLFFDPASFIAPGKEITVFIERGNPKRYYMDVSFLPKLAG